MATFKRGTTIHPKQIQIIKLAQKEIGLDDDTYRDLLQEMFGVGSCTRLSLEQANELIDELQRKGFRLVGKKGGRQVQPSRKASAGRAPGIPRRGGKVIGLASADELAKIEAVAGLVQWQYDDGYQRWLTARFHLDRVRTAGEAYKVIEGLKKLFENQMKKTHGADWWLTQLDDPEVRRYIRSHCPAEYADGVKFQLHRRGLL